MTHAVQNKANLSCRICAKTDGNRFYKVEEIMFGSGETFDYLECASCGTLQIASIPKDLHRYYQKSYAAYSRRLGIRLFLSKRAAVYQWNGFCPIGWGQTILSGRNIAIDAIKYIKARKTQSLLEIGCGSGALLHCLHYLGFRSLMGIDPFIGEDALQNEPFPIWRENFKDVKGIFDLIILNHVFEHISDPIETMQEIKKHLTPCGIGLILIPVSGCVAWKEYKTNWVQLDAPRHLFLHTRAGIELLCQRAGLVVKDVLWNSSEFQFIGSDQCRNGISLVSPKSIYAGGTVNRIKLLVGKARLKSRVSELNKFGLGDQACFIIRKKSAENEHCVNEK